MRSRDLIQLARAALLVAVLLLTQAAVATHVDLDDSHPAGDSCALCAGSSVLGSAIVASIACLELVAISTQILPREPVSHSEFPRRYFLARGPPSASC